MKDAGCDIQVCDIMVRKYLPAMRAEMVLRLVQREGISQSDAAKRLGVSRAAMQVLQIARLDQVFTIYDTVNDAQNT